MSPDGQAAADRIAELLAFLGLFIMALGFIGFVTERVQRWWRVRRQRQWAEWWRGAL